MAIPIEVKPKTVESAVNAPITAQFTWALDGAVTLNVSRCDVQTFSDGSKEIINRKQITKVLDADCLKVAKLVEEMTDEWMEGK